MRSLVSSCQSFLNINYFNLNQNTYQDKLIHSFGIHHYSQNILGHRHTDLSRQNENHHQ